MTPLEPKTPARPARTATAPLLYWLLVLCGLAGCTLQRLDAFDDVVPLWIGTVVGLGIGQLVAGPAFASGCSRRSE